MNDSRVSNYYLNFKKKYADRISDVPSIDDVTDFYLKNKDKVNFADLENQGYPFIVDLENAKKPPIGNYYDGYYYIDFETIEKQFPKGYITIPENDNRNFILFERKERTPYFYPDQCKLWINTKLENCFNIAILLANFINENHSVMSADGEEAKTCYKISTRYKRNDTITIYTNYMEIDSLINFLSELKKQQPKLFKTDRKTNPLVPKIDGFISYADVTHSTSGPGLIAEVFQDISSYHKKEIDALPKDQQHAFVKSLILKRILSKSNYGFYHNDSMLNTENFCSVRLNDIPFGKITYEEGEKHRNMLKKELDKLETELANAKANQM